MAVTALAKTERPSDSVTVAVGGSPLNSAAALEALVDKINELVTAVEDHETRIAALEAP